MFLDIYVMLSDKGKRLDEVVGGRHDVAKRTTIILGKGEREFIDSLIRDGKEPGIKPLISKMLDVYRSLMVFDWRFPSEYYCGISRVAFVNVELLNILVQQVPVERLVDVGRRMGEALRVSLESTLGLRAADRGNWVDVFKRLSVQGFGEFLLRDKYVLVKAPFLGDARVWRGVLEGLLGVELDVKSSVPPLVFEVLVKGDDEVTL